MLLRAGRVGAGLALSAPLGSLLAAPDSRRLRIGACDWSLGKMATPACFEFAKEIGLDGVQVSLGSAGDDMKLRRPEVQQQFKEAARASGVEIASLAIGEMNNIPYKSDPRTETWVSDSVQVSVVRRMTARTGDEVDAVQHGEIDHATAMKLIEWAVDNRRAYNIRVINLSLGHPVTEPSLTDPLCQAVERAVAAGITVVVSAGNHGVTSTGEPVLGGITSPGNAAAALTVGAIDTKGTLDPSDDVVPEYSSKGPTPYDIVVKPDVVAPGTRIVSLEASRSYLSATYPQWHIAGKNKNAYLRLTGRSGERARMSATTGSPSRQEISPKKLPRGRTASSASSKTTLTSPSTIT